MGESEEKRGKEETYTNVVCLGMRGSGGGGGEVRDKMGKICISVFFAPVSG